MDKTISSDFDTDQTNEEELLETEETLEQDESDESVDDGEELEKLRSENKKLTEIIKRRKEREEKTSTSKPTQNSTNNSQTLSREEAILVAGGFSEEDLDYLNVVAKGTGLPIKEAKEHPLFESYLQKIADEKKAKRAKLGASKGSSVNKPVDISGMTPEQHQKYWKERMGN